MMETMSESFNTLSTPALGDDYEAQLAQLFESEGLVDTVPNMPQWQPDSELPLSFAQELLWLVDGLQPGNTAYNVRWAMRIHGRLDVTALQRALSAIAARHPVLLTTYQSIDGRPVQRLAEGHTVPIHYEDWRTQSAVERDQMVADWIAADSRRPFDLTRDALHCSLLELGGDEWVLVLALHHIMCDGWSRSIFFRELAVLYKAEIAGQVPDLPCLPV